jgi:hypothetical protein
MDTLWKQHAEAWAKRKETLIESMSLEDRKFSKVQAAMKQDTEAQKLLADYESKRSELQKKVDDGIKWEVDRKESAIEETKKLVEEGLQVASPAPAAASKLDIGNISFGPNGMPMFKQTQAAAASIPSKASQDAEVVAKQQQVVENEAVKNTGKTDTKSESRSSAPTTKDSTLSDVVAALNQLNSKMGQLISTTESGHKDVAKAAKSNNANLFAR